MRSRRPSQEHTDAVARRVAELSAQLAATRAVPAADDPGERHPGALDQAVGDDWWSDHTRVVERPALTVVPPVPERPDVSEATVRRAHPPDAPAPSGSAAPSLPVPGRHAARRPFSWAPDLVPEPLRGRVRLGSTQLSAVAVLVALGLAVTCWWVVRGDPEAPVPVALEQVSGEPGAAIVTSGDGEEPGPAAPAPLETAAPNQPAPHQTGESVTVDVAGKVRRPGIVVLDAGARVVDALEQAGGARAGVDLTSLNLARVLVDGEQVVVGAAAGSTSGSAPPAAGLPPGSGPAPATLVDLNLADQTLLETLPQVGPVTATAIIAWRAEHGAFTSVTELLEVDGIGDATLAQLTPLVTV